MFSRRTAIFAGVGMTMSFCAGCGSTEPAPNDASSAPASPSSSTVTAAPTPVAESICSVGVPGPPTTQSAFTDHLPDHFLVKEICASDVGPALGGKEAVAGLSDLAAAEVADSYSSPDRVVLKALVGQAESGDASPFVDAFLSRAGETR